MKIFVLFIGILLSTINIVVAQGSGQVLSIKIKKDVFADEFFLLLDRESSDGTDFFDAVKISDGFVSIASLEKDKQRLSVHARPFPKVLEQVPLIVKGYTAGVYMLVINGEKLTSNDVQVSLLDRQLNRSVAIESNLLKYEFNLDSTALDEKGLNRFSLILSKVIHFEDPPIVEDRLLAFPNPFNENIRLNVKGNAAVLADIRIIDLSGKVCLQFKFKDVLKDDVLDIPCSTLAPGIYVLEWRSGSRRKTLKIVKI